MNVFQNPAQPYVGNVQAPIRRRPDGLHNLGRERPVHGFSIKRSGLPETLRIQAEADQQRIQIADNGLKIKSLGDTEFIKDGLVETDADQLKRGVVFAHAFARRRKDPSLVFRERKMLGSARSAGESVAWLIVQEDADGQGGKRIISPASR